MRKPFHLFPQRYSTMTSARPRTHRRLRALAAAAGCAALAFTVGCSHPADSPDAGAEPPRDSAAATISTAPPTPAATYRQSGKLCAALDLSPAVELFGPAGLQQDDLRRSKGSVHLQCTITVGDLPDGAILLVQADIGEPDSGRTMYEGLRQAQRDLGPISEMADLGSGAYSYVDELTGTNVVTYDANLYLTVTASPLRLGTTLPADLPSRLTGIAVSAMRGLRA
ncbi:hypothetical protein AB0C22_26465 [Micromonospora sp. NPDC048894]|uniref:hypothetical protein n=1 Tax=Micromonospora sp. NPDC048894 TaxID=3155493 RepID=UPI00340A9DFA